ncbi:class I SAM-dependent methyltransferase [Lichenihabitans sp. PAMC28606]|uniref:class I SAM-dependent methyltransferase n=1 Tax=Lichenihabitans sp. PAMC28606 TaxID=2880932 RepID=UPI0039B49B6F
MLEVGILDVVMPDGQSFRFGGRVPGPAAVMTIKDANFAKRLIGGGDIGIAESFLHGEWESPNLTRFLELFCLNRPIIEKLGAHPIVRIIQAYGHWRNRNTKAGSKRNIFAHYDLGNAFYSSWLDKSMTYSSALFEDASGHSAMDLSAAQEVKYRNLADQVGIDPGHHILEIGCGWGGFAEFAAKSIGCRVTGLTISQAQHDFAQRRIFDAGLNDKVEIKLLDYRDERGTYDRIASIEMFEAVGEAYWPSYFTQLADRLKPNGLAGLQVITIRDSLFASYRREMDFIRKYVFPGGMLPSPSIMRELGTAHGFRLSTERVFGHDYAKTLSLWRTSFRAAWPGLLSQGFDEHFRRLWEYYLAYCEAGFLSELIDVRQMVFAKTA